MKYDEVKSLTIGNREYLINDNYVIDVTYCEVIDRLEVGETLFSSYRKTFKDLDITQILNKKSTLPRYIVFTGKDMVFIL